MQEWYFEFLATEHGSSVFSGDKYVFEPDEYWFDHREQVHSLIPKISAPALIIINVHHLLFLIDIIDEAISWGFLHSHNLCIGVMIEETTKQPDVVLDKLLYS